MFSRKQVHVKNEIKRRNIRKGKGRYSEHDFIPNGAYSVAPWNVQALCLDIWLYEAE